MSADVFAQLPNTRIAVESRADGVFIVRSETELGTYDRCVGDWLERWAEERPGQVFIAERHGSTWDEVSYAEFRTRVRAVAQGLIDLGLESDGQRPLVILSGNSVDHALIKMAAMYIGVPVTPVSVAYSLMSRSHDRLQAIIAKLNPCAVFADDAELFRASFDACKGVDLFIASRNIEQGSGVHCLKAMLETEASEEVDRRFAAIGPDTHAKYMLTSGSTGTPKVVVNTQRMMCSNQQMIAQYWPFVETKAPRVLDWLPWSHTFGTNHNFNLVLRNGGSLYIDSGKPLPGLIGETIRNLRHVKPNLFFNVPKGYEVLLEQMRDDQALCQSFFSNLDMLFYAGAALSRPVWDELKQLCEATGNDVFFTTEWGATETAPAITNVHWRLDQPGNIGVPFPGVEIKFVPNGSKLEMRIKGPIVFNEYLHDPEKSAEAFDEEGFYRIGDAGLLQDPDNASAGIRFDGRVSEDFKLSTGTWVCVASIRAQVHKFFGDLVTDVVVTGHDRDYLGLLVIPGPRMRKLAEDKGGTMTGSELMQEPHVREELNTAMTLMAQVAKGSAQKVCRLVVLDTPAEIEKGEVTDKGNLNQRKMLETRGVDVERLYAEKPDQLVLSII
ncbi:feruloyl-CoA synthase [Marinobacterium sediminicola]|uniref:Feruloyl-CoA synthase n=1 Tax=Marinobacterium sediminicola TaxID=518898 RepID=A0ABY1S012_9GAMM|nr:feruloyl-CoA synthase [Marinobacterium sediminicola]ULG70076.1 feruloyl-CoA synthase [Marinobacterium sediminicola]SMR74532.1 feruloyl-CoA synthase [Marinobacterium sediminicola]